MAKGEAQPAMYRQTERVQTEKRLVAQRFLRETAFYTVFLAIFVFVTLNMRPPWAYEASSSIQSTAFANITKVRSPDDIYKQLLQVIKVIFASGSNNTPKSIMVLDSALLLGRVRLRQVRRKINTGCRVSSYFTGIVPECQDDDLGYEETTPFGSVCGSCRTVGGASVCTCTESRWRWSSTDELCKSVDPILGKYCRVITVGRTDIVYPNSGYVVDLPSADLINATQAYAVSSAGSPPDVVSDVMAQLNQLKSLNWIDHKTAFVSVDFSTYNVNLRVLTAVRGFYEVLGNGQVVPKLSIQAVSLRGFDTKADIANFALELLLSLCVLLYFYGKITDIVKFFRVRPRDCHRCNLRRIAVSGFVKRIACPNCSRPFNPFQFPQCPECHKDIMTPHRCYKGFFQDMWNWIDIINYTLFIVVIGFRLTLRFDMRKLTFAEDMWMKFVPLYPLAWQQTFIGFLNSFNMLIGFVKTLKYLGKMRRMGILVRTLKVAAPEVIKFLVLAMILYLGFSLTFILSFGDTLFDYRSWVTAAMTLWRAAMYNFDYVALRKANRVLAIVWFTLYILMIPLIIFNMFISILEMSFNKAKKDLENSKLDYLNSSLKEWWAAFRVKFKFCVGRTSLFSDAHALLTSISQIKDLSSEQRDELNLFRKEMTDLPDELLLHQIVKLFGAEEASGERNFADYVLLKHCVIHHRAERRKELVGLWGEAPLRSQTIRSKAKLRKAEGRDRERTTFLRKMESRLADIEALVMKKLIPFAAERPSSNIGRRPSVFLRAGRQSSEKSVSPSDIIDLEPLQIQEALMGSRLSPNLLTTPAGPQFVAPKVLKPKVLEQPKVAIDTRPPTKKFPEPPKEFSSSHPEMLQEVVVEPIKRQRPPSPPLSLNDRHTLVPAERHTNVHNSTPERHTTVPNSTAERHTTVPNPTSTGIPATIFVKSPNDNGRGPTTPPPLRASQPPTAQPPAPSALIKPPSPPAAVAAHKSLFPNEPGPPQARAKSNLPEGNTTVQLSHNASNTNSQSHRGAQWPILPSTMLPEPIPEPLHRTGFEAVTPLTSYQPIGSKVLYTRPLAVRRDDGPHNTPSRPQDSKPQEPVM